MAIQMRRGSNSDFNPSKMLPGEIAVTTDGTRKVYAAFKANDVKELASKEDVQGLINGFTSVVDREIAEAEQRIESKGQQVLETIPDLYEEVSARADEAVRTKADAIVCSVSGVNPIAKDSSNDYLRNLKLYGKTTQITTTGKNLLENVAVPLTAEYGITSRINADKSITVNGTATDNVTPTINKSKFLPLGEYILSGNSENIRLYVHIQKADGTWIYNYANTKVDDGKFSLSEDYTTLSCGYEIINGVTVSNETIYPMIRLASITDQTYEPFTGNQPSPSPQYPQPLESVGKWGNLLENTAVSYTSNGINFVVNKDKSVTANGTASATAFLTISDSFIAKAGVRYYIGDKANGGSDYYMRIRKTDGTFSNQNGYFLFNEDTSGLKVEIRIESGTVLNNVTFYPMIVEADNGITEYRPYSGQKEVESGVLWKNELENTAVSQTIYGVTFTVNDDKSVSVSGTANANAILNITSTLRLKQGEYIFSGCPINGNNATYSLEMYRNGSWFMTDYGTSPNITIADENEYSCTIRIVVKSGAAVNATFKPMIRKAEITDGTYEPYTKQSHISLVGDGLKGIPVTDSSLATYTDENGQMWCADYVDCERVVLVQRIGKLNLANLLDWTHFEGWKNPYSFFNADALKNALYVSGYSTVAYLMCNRFIVDEPERLVNYADISGRIGQASTSVYITLDGVTTDAEAKAYFAENETIVYYILATPIETPLSTSEITSYNALHSNYKVTSVMNDCGAFTEFSYNADMETWINNAIDERISKALAQYKEE